MTPTVLKRPSLALQCDWNEVLREKEGKAWVACKEVGSISKHGELQNNGIQYSNYPNIQASEGFRIENITEKSITLLHKDPNCKCQFIAPDKSFSTVHQKSIVGLDVTNGGLGISVCSQNKLLLWDTRNGDIRRSLEGHVWDVYTCRFFPSGIVILSGGADMQLKIWSAETGQCPVTMTGHTAAILDTAIVDRGRNIVSVSKDGTARLWDCGKAACLDVVSKENGIINSCALSTVNIDVGQPNSPPSEREISTEGKLLLLGCENGSLQGVGLQSRKTIFNVKYSSAVNCCCFLSPSEALCGTHDGHIYLLDLRDTQGPLITWEESASPVLTLLPVKDGFFTGRESKPVDEVVTTLDYNHPKWLPICVLTDGTCTFLHLNNDETIQLTGPDFDPVYKIATDGINIYTCCRDGRIRKYASPVAI